jgi:ligand-binding sensor domain-containing protein
MKLKIFSLLILFGQINSQRWSNISTFGFINSIVRYQQNLYVGTEGGVIILDAISHRIIGTYVTDDRVILASPDPTTQDVYYISKGILFRWNPFLRTPQQLGYVGYPKSMAIDARYIYLDFPDGVRKYTKTGSLQGTVTPPKNLLWCGDKSVLKTDNPEVVYFSPYFKFTSRLGQVEYTVFYPDMDKLWVGTKGDGIYLYNKRFHRELDSIKVGVWDRDVRSLYFLNGTLWIGCARGITRVKGNIWESFSKTGTVGLQCDEIEDISGSDDILWFASSCGVLKYSRDRFTLYSIPASIGTYVTAVLADPPYLWVGTDQGIGSTLITGGPFEGMSGVVNAYINEIVKGRKRIYFLTEQGVFSFNREKRSWSRIMDPRAWLDGDVETGASYNDTIYFMALMGLVVLDEDKDKFFYLNTPFSPRNEPSLSMGVDEDRVYVGTVRGLYVLDKRGGTWMPFREGDGLVDDYVQDVLVVGDSVYIATKNGLSIFYWR